jgi:dTDP-4-dehydrorhamnose reductase
VPNGTIGANSRLSGSKLETTYGIRLPHWRESLDIVLDRLLANG